MSPTQLRMVDSHAIHTRRSMLARTPQRIEKIHMTTTPTLMA